MPAKTLFGRQLKYWRQTQGISQLSLATLACTTPRHVSFLENGRSRPSDQMVVRLADALEVPIRERNQLLVAAGYEGTYTEEELDAETSAVFMKAVRYTLESHAPYPAIVRNRYHEVVDMNEPARKLFMTLDPQGMNTSMIEWVLAENSPAREVFENFCTVAWGMIFRIRGEAASAPHDKRLQELAKFAELRAKTLSPAPVDRDAITCPTMKIDGCRVSLMGMDAHFGSTRDANLEGLRLELLHPRDDESEKFLRRLAVSAPLRMTH